MIENGCALNFSFVQIFRSLSSATGSYALRRFKMCLSKTELPSGAKAPGSERAVGTDGQTAIVHTAL